MTRVAQECRAFIVPYVDNLSRLLAHRATRVRWEATHAPVAALTPVTMGCLVPTLGEMLRHDPSRIVRDHIVQALGKYAGVSAEAAAASYPWLLEALTVFDGKHTAGALKGLAVAVAADPRLAVEVRAAGERYLDDPRAGVRRAARALVKAAAAPPK